MLSGKSLSALRGSIVWVAVFCVTTMFASPARAAFHLWNIQEVYSNSSGTLQFIEMIGLANGQNPLNTFGGTMTSANIGNTMSNVFNPMNDLPSSNTLNRTFLIGTAGIQAAGGPAPDYFVPNGFLFSAGGSITSNFAQNGGAFTALPIDGTMSRIWNGGNNVINSPMNFAGQSGVVVGVPEPTTMILTPLAVSMYGLYHRLSRRRKAGSAVETS